MSKIMSERLKQLRTEKGLTRKEKKLTQEKAAEEMFMSRTTLAKYESPDTDTDSMPTRELMRLAKYYDCDPRYLTGDIPCKEKDTSDIHSLTALLEDAIVSLMQRKANAVTAYENGRVFEVEDHLLVANFISYLITHIDDSLMQQYVEYSAFNEIGKRLIQEKRESGHLTDEDNFSTSETIRNTVVHDYFAQKAKDELKENFKTSLEEWLKGRIDLDVERKLEEINQL